MLRICLIALSLLASFGPATAAGYPERVVRIVVPYPPGGTTDILARIVAVRLEQRLGQSFIVDNRGGASGNIGSAAVAHAAPDGYTLLMGTINTHGINPSLLKNLPYDAEKDFAPITVVATTPNVLIVHPSLGVSTVAEFIALARQKPGSLDFGSTSTGGSPHMSGELFKALTKTDIQHVPYRGGGPMLNDLIAGQIKSAFDNLPSAIGHVRAGSVRALAVTTPNRWPSLPDVPAMAETVPGYEVSAWFALLAPAKTPRDIVELLHREVADILKEEPIRQRLSELGAEPGGNTPDEFARQIATEIRKWADVVAATGATAD
jgi:tripartite-type tricarboxylate transporter receptor subunit TctC